MVVVKFVAEPTVAFSRSCVGTHEYLVPDLISSNGHANGVDCFEQGHEVLPGRERRVSAYYFNFKITWKCAHGGHDVEKNVPKSAFAYDVARDK